MPAPKLHRYKRMKGCCWFSYHVVLVDDCGDVGYPWGFMMITRGEGDFFTRQELHPSAQNLKLRSGYS